MKPSYYIKFIVPITLVMVLTFISENSHGRPFALNDFKVYYNASLALFNGGQVYGTPYGLIEGYYKYSPFMAIMVKPFTWLPYYTACVLQFSIVCISTIAMLILLFNMVNNYLFNGQVKSPNAILLIVTLCFATHLVRELLMGNINLLLLLLLCLALFNNLKKRYLLSGILLALVLAAKPFFILLFIPLFLHKQYKTLISTALSLGIFAIIPALFTGLTTDIDLHKQWLAAMLNHSDKFFSPDTIDMIMRIYISRSLPSFNQYIIMLLACILYVVIFYFAGKRRSVPRTDKDLIIEWFVIIALLPSLFKTDTQHFLFTVPLILILCCYFFTHRNVRALVVFILAILLYDVNSSDLFGRNIAGHIYNSGVLGMGNIILIALSVGIYLNYLQKGESHSSASLN